jgi:ABC-type multidrug transport system fused ATPase/permease subunit
MGRPDARNIAFGMEDARIDEARVLRVVKAARLDALAASLPQGLDSRVGERMTRVTSRRSSFARLAGG